MFTIYNTDTEAKKAIKKGRRIRNKKGHSRLVHNTRLKWFRPCFCLAILFVALVMALPSLDVAAQAAEPGANDPIVPSERRTLFPDQHALIAMPRNPNTLAPPITYTDWARNANAGSLQLQNAFANGLQGTNQARAAAGHILNQQREQVAVGRFLAGTNTLQVDVVTTSGQLQQDASVALEAFSTSLARPGYQVVDSFGVATGDLSVRTDEAGAGHDEVVACYPVSIGGDQVQMRVTVLDYTDLSHSGVVQVTADASHIMFNYSQSFRWVTQRTASDSFVSCAAGDIDGDGVDEVVLAYLVSEGGGFVDVFRYTNDGIDQPTFERVGSTFTALPLRNPAFPGNPPPFFAGTVDVVTGDFNADGRLEIAVATVSQQTPNAGSNLGFYPSIFVLSSDANYQLTLQSTFVTNEVALLSINDFNNAVGSFACNQPNARQACEYTRAALVSGLFKYNPDPVVGFDFNRRQLAIVFNMPFAQEGGLRALGLEVSNDLQTIKQIGTTVTIPQQPCSSGFCPSSPRFAVGAGGYVGSADISNPLWSLAITNWEATQNGSADLQSSGQFRLVWLKPLPPGSAGGFTTAQFITPLGAANISGPANGRLPVVAWDRAGSSVWLGSPVHLLVYDLIKPEYIIQEPPKHTYWWPPNATNAADGVIMDLSRKYGFYVELSDEESRDYSSTHTDQTDWTIGGSVAVTGKASVTGGVDAGILSSAKATASVSVKGQIGYDYNENESSYNSDYRSQTTTFTGQTNADDLLIGDLMRMDVWRYPVSGIEVEDGLHAFWEIAFPGNTVSVRGGGLNFDWYNPPHENGNILSYPPLTGSSYAPEDCCAEFTFVENNQEVTEATPFLDPTLLAWDGTSGSIALNFSQQSGEGSTKSYTHKLKESLDVQVGYKTEAKSPGGTGGVTAETSVDVNINNSNSWADVDTEAASTNNSTGFKLVKQVGNPNQSYFFMPQFYLAQSGTTKVSYAVDPLGTKATFWPSTYGQLPDPALNLPRRFSPTTPIRNDQIVWVVNAGDDAKRMRGFFVRYNTPDAADQFPLVAGAVTDGEVIRVEADVYNYSVAQGFGGLGVAFQAVKYNPATNQEIGDPVTLNCGPGSIGFLSLDPRARKRAVCVWDTKNFGPTVPSAIQYYRVYVTLDPDNHIDEIYDGTVGPGQNNQGWGLVAIAHPELTYRTPTPTVAVPNGADVRLTNGTLAIMVDGQLTSGFAQVVREQLTPLRVCVDSDQSQTGYHHILIWSVDAADRGTLIGDKMLPGVGKGGNSCVWIPDFRFEQEGRVSVYAEVLETRSDALPDNATDVLTVDVAPIPTPPASRLKGVATGVASDKSNGTVHLSGKLSFGGDLDLSKASVIISRVLDETAGAGELVPGVQEETGQPLTLSARVVRKGDYAIFETPSGQLPRVRVDLKVTGGTLDATLRVNRAAVLTPQWCGSQTDLSTEILVLDGENAPLEIAFTEPWTCKTDGSGRVRQLTLTQK
jgi:hypothetical protein